jgi:hypothetical protein
MMAAMSDWSSALERRLDLERANRAFYRRGR